MSPWRLLQLAVAKAVLSGTVLYETYVAGQRNLDILHPQTVKSTSAKSCANFQKMNKTTVIQSCTTDINCYVKTYLHQSNAYTWMQCLLMSDIDQGWEYFYFPESKMCFAYRRALFSSKYQELFPTMRIALSWTMRFEQCLILAHPKGRPTLHTSVCMYTWVEYMDSLMDQLEPPCFLSWQAAELNHFRMLLTLP